MSRVEPHQSPRPASAKPFRRRHRSLRLAGALLAGSAGTTGVNLIEQVERKVLGRPPVYSAESLARMLLLRWGERRPSRRRVRRVAKMIRWCYGTLLGTIYVSRRTGPPWLPAGLLLGLAIFLVELVVLPRTGLVPPLRTWPGREIALLLLYTTAFGLATELARQRRPRRLLSRR